MQNMKKQVVYFSITGFLLLLLASWLYQMLFDPASNIPWFIPLLPIVGGLLFPKKLFFISPIILITGVFIAALIVPITPMGMAVSTDTAMGSWVFIFLIINPLLSYLGSTGHKDVFEWMYK